MEKNDEKLKWKRATKLGSPKIIKPLLGNLLLLVEEEKKRTLKQIEDAQKLLEKLKKR